MPAPDVKYHEPGTGCFTGHNIDMLEHTLKYIGECALPVEVFDAFLAEYVKTKDLDRSIFFAMCEWDC